MISGTSSRWEPERIDSPTTSTSSSSAAAAIWAGVSRIPWYTTSIPASRAATAICSAPFACPSRPGLPTRIFGGPPIVAACSCTWRRTLSMSSATLAPIPPTPVGARYSPNTSRSASAHSPTVPPALASAIVAGIRFSVVAAVSAVAPTRARPRPSPARRATASSSAIWPRSASGSSFRMCDSPSRLAVRGDGSVSVKLLTPTTFVSPDSMRRTRSVFACTSRPLISSIIPNEPPPSSTHCSSSQAAVHSSSTFASIDLRALEDVAVLQQVRLVGQDLLHPQRPLLVPGTGQAQRLVPARQLQGAGRARRGTA